MPATPSLSVWEQALAQLVPPPRPELEAESDWRVWIPLMLPGLGEHPMGEHHAVFWDWIWSLAYGQKPDYAQVNIWPRGGAKSTSAEGGVVAVGARQSRRFVLYCSETQEQADDHVGNIGELLASPSLERNYPDLCDRAVDKFGSSKGWRRNRLRTKSGLTVDALGLDSRVRGIKLEDARPDFIILDDIDGEEDTPATTDKKIRTITRRLLPAGSSDVAVLAVQNLVHSESIFARMAGLATAKSDFLGRRKVVGPIPALFDMEWEEREDAEGHRFVITGGRPSWVGQSLETCQRQVDEWGLSAFLSEAQHDTEPPSGEMYDHITWRRCLPDEVPWDKMNRVEVWVDPAVTEKDGSDANGIQIDGITNDGKIYRLWSWEERSSPERTLRIAIRKGMELNASVVGVETNQGGDTWQSVYREAVRSIMAGRTGDAGEEMFARMPVFKEVKASNATGSKIARQQKQVFWYEKDRFIHVQGTHTLLERALKRFPKKKPYDLADTSFWAAKSLIDGHVALPSNVVNITRTGSGW